MKVEKNQTRNKLSNINPRYPLASNQIDKSSSKVKKTYTFKLILKLYTVFGFIIMTAAIGYFYISTLSIQLTPDQKTALYIAVSSALVTLVSGAALVIRNQIEKNNFSRKLILKKLEKFVLYWSEFENEAQVVLEEIGYKYNKHSTNQMIVGLLENNYISINQRDLIQYSKEVRNRVVHEQEYYPPEELEDLSSFLLDIIENLGQRVC